MVPVPAGAALDLILKEVGHAGGHSHSLLGRSAARDWRRGRGRGRGSDSCSCRGGNSGGSMDRNSCLALALAPDPRRELPRGARPHRRAGREHKANCRVASLPPNLAMSAGVHLVWNGSKPTTDADAGEEPASLHSEQLISQQGPFSAREETPNGLLKHQSLPAHAPH